MDTRIRDNLTNKDAGNPDCSICKELFASLEKFFTIVEGARLQHTSDWLTVDDIASELRISKTIVYRLIRNGELEAVNIVENNGKIAQRGHYRIKKQSLNSYLDSRKAKPLPNEPIRSRSPQRWPKVKNHLGL